MKRPVYPQPRAPRVDRIEAQLFTFFSRCHPHPSRPRFPRRGLAPRATNNTRHARSTAWRRTTEHFGADSGNRHCLRSDLFFRLITREFSKPKGYTIEVEAQNTDPALVDATAAPRVSGLTQKVAPP
jgi:hypothetical protein